MKVSLIQFRLELDDGFNVISSLHHSADEYFATYLESCLTSIVEENYKPIPELHRGNRIFREYTIETFVVERKMTQEDKKLLKNEGEEGSKTNVSTIHYFSGNPTVEVTKGIMHLYKDKYHTILDVDSPRSEMICMLGVPAKYSCQDLQKFIAPARDSIHHIQIIRDGIPNQYLVLIKFHDQSGADSFYREYVGKPYNMLENEFAHLVYVAKVETVSGMEGGYLPVSGLTELPMCPVCLERMDESVEGILTILCNHSFHNNCLMKWQDNCCPVCRYVQTPERAVEQTCFQCDARESLWICLVCGHIGCGRYQELHAYQHFQQTAHTFSMHLENKRVWDYAGDNYVHRLIQSKGDGKLVSLDNSEQIEGEKMDSLTLEYTYLLTNQLESQRLYFEEKIDFIEKDANERLSLMESTAYKSEEERKDTIKKLEHCEKNHRSMERKYETVVGKVANLSKELHDEKQMNACLRDNQSVWQAKLSTLECQQSTIMKEKNHEISELQSQVKDLMKHIEVQSAMNNVQQDLKEDIQGGQMFMGASSNSSKPRSKNRTKKY